MTQEVVDDVSIKWADLDQLIKLTAAGGASGSQTQLRRMARRYKTSIPALSEEIIRLLSTGTLRAAANVEVAQPLDTDTNLPLIRREDPVVLSQDPILEEETLNAISQVIFEYLNPDRMIEAGLTPTRDVLFVGEPGVGKTMTARWIAAQLSLPLIVLDLSAVMSSYLGRTGVNVRRVLNYAREHECVLLIDEIDAVAKRRDDSSEVGELKRLVTVLLQEIDAWPDGSLMIAATNHPDLLDPAIWRRFDSIIEFPAPTHQSIARALRLFLDDDACPTTELERLAWGYLGESLSAVERDVLTSRRIAVKTGEQPVSLLHNRIRQRFAALSRSERVTRALSLQKSARLSQRMTSELTGVSRDTLRRYGTNPAE